MQLLLLFSLWCNSVVTLDDFLYQRSIKRIRLKLLQKINRGERRAGWDAVLWEKLHLVLYVIYLPMKLHPGVTDAVGILVSQRLVGSS